MFVSTLITYFIIMLASMAIIVCAVLCGMKWRKSKEAKDAQAAETMQVDEAQSEKE